MTDTLNELKDAFKHTELKGHCEDIGIALEYYEGDKDADSFIEWYTETYSADIIYYHNAMAFLLEHDPSLHECMAKAQDYGYEPKDLNSEILASLLLQDVLSEALYGLKDELEAYFEELEESEA